MKNRLALLVLASAALLSSSAVAEDRKPAAGPTATDVQKAATLELYGALLPFVEYVQAENPTPVGFSEGPGHIGTTVANYDGLDGPPRGRMLSGTSHFGVRASLALVDQLRILGQFETAMPIDGDPNPWEAQLPNRNSYLGFTGDWGTVAFGLLDTPYKWTTTTMVNPIKGGYVADYTPVIGTPGFLATAVNPAQRWGISGESNAAFYRREANSLQYWSPTVFGLYGRASYTLDELRPSDSVASVRSNPYIVSLAAGFDLDKALGGAEFAGLRIRYAWESHHDYFGLAYIYNALSGAPDRQTRTANDWGNKLTVQYTLPITPDVKTRVVGIGEELKYTLHATLPNDANMYSRPAFYALLEQTVFEHHVWGAYGRAYSGKCTRVPQADGTPIPCSTAFVGAKLMEAGYMYAFTDKVQAYVMGYRLVNERSALYVTTPHLPREGLSPGLDTTGVGVGFYYAFGTDLLD